MHRMLMRAVVLAIFVLALGATAVTAQTETEGRLIGDEDGSVLVGVGNDVALPAGAEADAVVIVNGVATIEGTTEAIIAVDSDVTVTGTAANVEGIFVLGGSLTVTNGAAVENVGYIDADIAGVDATLVSGEINDIQTDVATFLAWALAWVAILFFFAWIGIFIATLAFSLFMVAFGTSQARRAAWTIGNDPLKVLVVGLIAAIVPWLVFGLLAITVVGLALAVLLAIIWLFVAFLGYLTVGLWIGERILRRARTSQRPYGAAFLGTLILILLSWLPIVSALALWVGLGAVTLAGWRVLRGRGGGAVPPGYGSPYGQPYQVPPPPYAPPPYAPPAQYPPQQPPPPAGWGQG